MNSLVVIKCGGSTMEQLPPSFFNALADLQKSGRQIIIVHGGGPAINQLLDKLAIPANFVDGLRVTCDQTMNVVEMVLAGTINKQLVRRLLAAGAKAWGASGVDGGLLVARQKNEALGLVGEIERVETEVLQTMLAAGYLPVVAPLAASADGEQVFNLNADTAAGAVAAALGAEKLVMITDVPGILQTAPNGEKRLLPEAQSGQIESMIASGDIYGGMIPKVNAALDALRQGVPQVTICLGTADDLIACVNGTKVGTTITGGAA